MWTDDRDLAVYEPALFGQWKINQQKQAGGSNGAVWGTSFTATGAGFDSARVSAGQMISVTTLDGTLDGAFEILAVVSASQLTVSTLRADRQAPALPVGNASGLIWRVYHFSPQRAAAHLYLRWRLKLPADAIAALDDACIEPLRMAETFCALALIFEAICQEDDQMELFEHKKRIYWGLFEQTWEGLELTRGGKVIWRSQTVQMERK